MHLTHAFSRDRIGVKSVSDGMKGKSLKSLRQIVVAIIGEALPGDYPAEQWH